VEKADSEALARLARLFKIVTLVSAPPAGRPLGRRELSAACECEVRTVQRDLALLAEAGSGQSAKEVEQAQAWRREEADTHRREMVSNVSHDLRTPLAALHGYLETLLMKEGSMTPQEQREYLQIALRHSERLAKLVGELFELARLDSREVQVNLEPFSLGELVQDVVQQYHLGAQQKSLRLRALLPDDLPLVYADIALIERVLDNLLENALRYTPEGGSVTLSLAPQPGRIEVRVADTGSGIRQEHLPHIFERFYRVPAQPEKPGCAGLGLAIAKRILELHGGTIRVESVPDQGTSFTFRLPVHASPGA